MTILGVDVAAGGEDKSVCAVRQDWVVPHLIKWEKAEPMETVGKIIQIARRFKPEKIVVDADGLGAGIFDRLREQNYPVLAFHGKYRCEKTDVSGELGFANWRSYAWWHMRELLSPDSDVQVALPVDDDLMGELCCPKWKLTSTGKIQVEPKEDIKKRLDRSTDHADSVIMAFCDLDNSEFEEAFAVYTEQDATRMIKDGLAPTADLREEEILERLLWQTGTPIDLFGLY